VFAWLAHINWARGMKVPDGTKLLDGFPALQRAISD